MLEKLTPENNPFFDFDKLIEDAKDFDYDKWLEEIEQENYDTWKRLWVSAVNIGLDENATEREKLMADCIHHICFGYVTPPRMTIQIGNTLHISGID